MDGAAVDVSLICFGENGDEPASLNGKTVAGINPDLTSGLNLTQAKPLTREPKRRLSWHPKEQPHSTSQARLREHGWPSRPIG